MPSGGDHRRTPYGSGPVDNPMRYRSPTRADRILRERREPILVDALGDPDTVRTVEHLSSADRERFDAQLAAWHAACALVVATDAASMAGRTVQGETVHAWLAARGDWQFVREQWLQTRRYR